MQEENNKLFAFTSISFWNCQKHESVFCDCKLSIIFLRDIFVHGLSMKTCFPMTHSKCSCKVLGMNTIFKSSVWISAVSVDYKNLTPQKIIFLKYNVSTNVLYSYIE